MKWSLNYKLVIGLVAIMLLGIFTPSCKSKKKCPDFTQVDGRVKVDRNGLAKKKRHKRVVTNRSAPNF